MTKSDFRKKEFILVCGSRGKVYHGPGAMMTGSKTRKLRKPSGERGRL